VLLGIGQVRVPRRRCCPRPRACAWRLESPQTRAKEGLALINGTQVSTALALAGLFGSEDVFAAARRAGAMSVTA